MGLEPTTPGTVVGRRRAEHDSRPVDFTSADLPYADLRRADPSGADLVGAFLTTEATQSHAAAVLTDLPMRTSPTRLGPTTSEFRGLGLRR
jgi:hypothetical protein